jgi:ABC-type transport system involved in multi-copper enzyme maturation permease subunit
MWPVIIRELRVGSRHWVTYWLRVLAASAAIAGAFHVWLLHQGMANQGGPFFARLHQVLFVAIWIFVPLLTADCLSKEKREGTLGLLFLTALTSHEIVLAKATAHGLRALSLWIAVVPITTVPFLLGGVGWIEITLSVLLNFSSLCLALGAGVIASSRTKSWKNASSLAAAIAMCCWIAMFFWFGVAVFRSMPFGRQIGLAGQFGLGVIFAGDGFGAGVWPEMALHGFFNLKTALIPCALCLLGSLVFLFFLLHVAALSIRRNWQDQPKTKRQSEVEAVFYTPVIAASLLRRWMRRTIERNPIGWLEQRSWTGRITAWVWFALMISFATMLLYPPFGGADYEIFRVLAWMLLVTVAFVAAGSFRRERETGAMELILVTPLSAREIVTGRLRGIWEQFAPAFLVWMAMVLYLAPRLRDREMWPALFRSSRSRLPPCQSRDCISLSSPGTSRWRGSRR